MLEFGKAKRFDDGYRMLAYHGGEQYTVFASITAFDDHGVDAIKSKANELFAAGYADGRNMIAVLGVHFSGSRGDEGIPIE